MNLIFELRGGNFSMANQPKKYKKFVATAATASLVASAIVPVASAAEFKDVTGNDHEVAINALSDEGIIKGYADGTFKPNQSINRGQVVKLLGRWLEAQGEEIPDDWKTEQRFNDLPVTAEEELVKYAALAKDAGVFAGSNGNLNHTQTMQRQQMAVVLVRAIKEIGGIDLVAEYKENGHVTEITDLDKAFSAEQRNAIVALEYAEITKVSAFNPANSITRGQFASFLYRTINNVLEASVAGVASIKAINNTTVEVTFDEEVTDVKALDFAIEGLTISNAAVKQTNKKVVVLTTSAQTGDKEYTVTLDGDKIGSFKGITAVIPTKVEMVQQSVQGKLGQQVTVKAQVTVAEGASKAGIPVTLFVPGSADGIKAPVTVEALTDENGVATHTYTRYAATNDVVTVYATGDRSKFSTGYVFWGVDTILAVEEVTTGATVNNGANKTYKVTFKNDVTGKPEANKTFNVGFLENMDITADKLANASINGISVKQLSNGTHTEAAQITTDSKGEATFTVSGVNATVTPVVYALNPISASEATKNNQIYKASALQATTAKVAFAATQAEYKIDITRDGGEVAATGEPNGREYKVVVKDKDGKIAKNEIVNVAFNEDVDRIISTNTKAKFVNPDTDKYYPTSGTGNTAKQISVKTNSKGEATFVIASEFENDYATPVAWIDINSANAKQGTLDEGEPTTVAAISHFQAPYLNGAEIKAYKTTGGKAVTKFDGNETAEFKAELVNQSGKVFTGGYTLGKVTYTVFNTGGEDIKVGDTVISPNRSETFTKADGASLLVTSSDKKSTSVRVVATGSARKDSKDFAFTAKEATATFTATNEVSNPYTGVIDLASINKTDKEIKFVGKDAVKYAGEKGKTYKYQGLGNTPIANADAFISELEGYVGQSVRVTYEEKDDVVSFYIISVGATTLPATGKWEAVRVVVNGSIDVAGVKAALKSIDGFTNFINADQDKIASDIFRTVSTTPYASAAAFKTAYDSAISNETATLTAINELKAAITAAQAKHDAAVEGTTVGQYAAGSKAIYKTAIATAQAQLVGIVNGAANSDTGSLATTVTGLKTTLATATTTFESAKVTNGSVQAAALATVNTALLAQKGAASATNLTAAKKAIVDNATVLGLDLTNYNKLVDDAARDAAITALATATPSGGYVGAAALNVALQAETDITAPKVVKAVLSGTTLTLTFDESISLTTGTLGISTVEFTNGNTTGIAMVTGATVSGEELELTVTTPGAQGLVVGSTISAVKLFDNASTPASINVTDAKSNVVIDFTIEVK